MNGTLPQINLKEKKTPLFNKVVLSLQVNRSGIKSEKEIEILTDERLVNYFRLCCCVRLQLHVLQRMDSVSED